MILFLSERVSDWAVRNTYKFRDANKFNRNIRNKKGMSESSLKGDPVVLGKKIALHDRSQGMLSLRKR